MRGEQHPAGPASDPDEMRLSPDDRLRHMPILDPVSYRPGDAYFERSTGSAPGGTCWSMLPCNRRPFVAQPPGNRPASTRCAAGCSLHIAVLVTDENFMTCH